LDDRRRRRVRRRGNWTAKVEYLHYDLRNFNCGVACGGFAIDTVSFSADAVRGGINYRF
jgi:opacity protein-like surface antigen